MEEKDNDIEYDEIEAINRRCLYKIEKARIRCANITEKERKRADEAEYRLKKSELKFKTTEKEKDCALYTLAIVFAFLLISV